MASDQPYQHPKDEKMVEESSTKTGQQQLYALPFAIQLRNTFAIEIIAKRFPVG